MNKGHEMLLYYIPVHWRGFERACRILSNSPSCPWLRDTIRILQWGWKDRLWKVVKSDHLSSTTKNPSSKASWDAPSHLSRAWIYSISTLTVHESSHAANTNLASFEIIMMKCKQTCCSNGGQDRRWFAWYYCRSYRHLFSWPLIQMPNI